MTLLASRKPFIVRSSPDKNASYANLFYVRDNGDEVCYGQISPIPGYLNNHDSYRTIN